MNVGETRAQLILPTRLLATSRHTGCHCGDCMQALIVDTGEECHTRVTLNQKCHAGVTLSQQCHGTKPQSAPQDEPQDDLANLAEGHVHLAASDSN